MFLLLALLSVILLPSPWGLVAALAVGAVGLFEVVYWHRRVRSRQVQTGAEVLVGATGEVTEALMPLGQIRLLGELWQARSSSELPRGTPVRVVALNGLIVEVEATNTVALAPRSG
jgi:membrane-bound serine protease (ClpP class)